MAVNFPEHPVWLQAEEYFARAWVGMKLGWSGRSQKGTLLRQYRLMVPWDKHIPKLQAHLTESGVHTWDRDACVCIQGMHSANAQDQTTLSTQVSTQVWGDR